MNILLLLLLIISLGTSVALLGGASILIYSIPGYLLLGLTGVLAVFAIRRNTLRAGRSAVLSAVILSGYVIARALTSPVEYQAQMDLFMVIAVLLTYLLTAQYLTNPRLRAGVIGALLFLMAIQAGIAVVQFKNGDSFMLLPWLNRPDYGWRASGFYGCPNHFAGFVEIAVLFGISMVLWSRWPAWLKLLTAWLCLVGVAVQLMSGSRGGYLSLSAGLIVVGIISLGMVRRVSPHRFWISLIGVLMAGGAIAGGVIFFARHSQILHNRIEAVAETGNMRLQLWQTAWEQAQINPVFGTGAGTYLFYGRKFLPSDIIHDPIYVHNDYLHLLAEYGWAGAAFMLLFLGTHLARGVNQLRGIVSERMAQTGRTQSTAAALSVGALSAVSALLVHSVVDFNLHITANALLMAFVFGLLANSGVRTESDPAGGRALAMGTQLLVPLLGAVLLLLCIPRLRAEYSGEMARRYFGVKEYSVAMGHALDSLALRQDDPNVYYYLGWSQYEISLDQESEFVSRIIATQAAETLGKGIELMPQDIRLLVAYAHVLRRSGQTAEADRWYQEALRWDPNSGKVHARYGSFLAETGRTAEARREFEKARDLHDNEIAISGLRALDTAEVKAREDAAAREKAAREPKEPLTMPALPVPEPARPADSLKPSPLLNQTRGF